VRHTIDRYDVERPDLDGTGGELARHLLNRFDLNGVKVEVTDKGNHYDPEAKAVRLTAKLTTAARFPRLRSPRMKSAMRCRMPGERGCWRCASAS
jgi:hypothetical protein